MTTKPTGPATVRIFPVPGRFVEGVPAIEQDVDAETAERLTRESRHGGGNAFTTTKPPETAPPPEQES